MAVSRVMTNVTENIAGSLGIGYDVTAVSDEILDRPPSDDSARPKESRPHPILPIVYKKERVQVSTTLVGRTCLRFPPAVFLPGAETVLFRPLNPPPHTNHTSHIAQH